MLWTLLSHLYKSFSRSASVGKDTAVQIMLGFIVVVLVGYSVAFGFALERIIVNTFRQENAVAFLNKLLVYYFLSGFATRYFFQSIPSLHAQPYLHLPISRGKIAIFLIGKSFIHVINLFVFFVFGPFAFNAVAETYGITQAWIWLVSLWFLSLINHLVVILAKANVSSNPVRLFAFIGACALIGYADYSGWFKLSQISAIFFALALNGSTLAWFLFLTGVLLYYTLYKTLIGKLYLEELGDERPESHRATHWNFLQRFGTVGAWVKLELLMIFRNKRSRELFLMHVLFLLLPLAFHAGAKNHNSYGSTLFFGVISSGFFIMNYGQFLFSWQAGHFDFTLTHTGTIRQFVEGKYWLLASTTVMWFLFSVPYALLGWHFFFIHLVASLYNIGVNILIVMNMSMWGARKIDLTHSGSLNFEGLGAAQWLMGIPLIAAPFVFYIPFALMDYPVAGLLGIGVLGLAGIVFHKRIIDITTLRLSRKRYLMADNFRQD